MRTEQEILDRIKQRQPNDFLALEWGEYVEALPLAAAREWLRPDFEPDDENPWGRFSTDAAVLDQIKTYMTFAWDKANNCRGLSANRAVFHYIAWIWLLGPEYDDLVAMLDDWSQYRHYGKPQLRAICQRFDIDWAALDNGAWCSEENAPNALTAADVPDLHAPI